MTTEYLAKISRSQEEAAERQANINELVVAAGKYRTGQRLEDPWVAGGDLLELNEGEGELELEEMVENEVGYGEGVAALPSGALRALLEDASLLTGEELDDDQKKQNVVYLMTIHASKGLEFDAIFLTGVEEGCLPITREPEDREYDSRTTGVDPRETEAVKGGAPFGFCGNYTGQENPLPHTQAEDERLFTGGLKYIKCNQSRFLLPLATLPKATVARMKWKPPQRL